MNKLADAENTQFTQIESQALERFVYRRVLARTRYARADFASLRSRSEEPFSASEQALDLLLVAARRLPDLVRSLAVSSKRFAPAHGELDHDTAHEALTERFLDSLGMRAREVRRAAGPLSSIVILSSTGEFDERLLELFAEQFGIRLDNGELRSVARQLAEDLRNWAHANGGLASKLGLALTDGNTILRAQVPPLVDLEAGA